MTQNILNHYKNNNNKNMTDLIMTVILVILFIFILFIAIYDIILWNDLRECEKTESKWCYQYACKNGQPATRTNSSGKTIQSS